jgi:hypothetical protein
MTAPDYIFPIVGCRVWRWDETGLKSVNSIPWQPGIALAAKCVQPSTHESPQGDCRCGVYAAKTFGHLRRMRYTESERWIRGEVFLWGRMVEHEEGWRAQFAYPKNFIVPISILPSVMSLIESWLTALIAYRCDISLLAENTTVPLWLPDSGFDPSGIGLIVKRCAASDERRREERRLKRGDRVAVLGHGIAVVEHADRDVVRAVLGNRTVLTIERDAVAWNGQNRRWETAPIAAISMTQRRALALSQRGSAEKGTSCR